MEYFLLMKQNSYLFTAQTITQKGDFPILNRCIYKTKEFLQHKKLFQLVVDCAFKFQKKITLKFNLS